MNICLEYLSINAFVESDDVSPPSPHGSNVSAGSQSTVAYINSDPGDTEYDMSDNNNNNNDNNLFSFSYTVQLLIFDELQTIFK